MKSFKNRNKLRILTHGDFDHIGSAKQIKEATGAKVAIHENDRKYLEEGRFNWPPGVTRWGISTRFLVKPFFKHKKIPPLKSDIVLTEKDFPLDDYGIDGKIIYTPGHTSGSVSVVLSSGEAFVGCMAHNGFPFTFHPGLSIYAEDITEIKKSWDILIRQGAKMIYPGHGNAFPVEKMMKLL